MKSLLNFFVKTGKLKQAERKGWLLYGVKNPATSADHIFRATILAWALNKEKKLDEKKLLKSILIHHLPDIFLGEQTPYDSLLPKDILLKENRKAIDILLQKLSQVSGVAQKKTEIERKKQEEKVLKRLVFRLPEDIKKEVFDLWSETGKRRTKLAKFSWEVGKIESYLQALEYRKTDSKIKEINWTKWMKKNLKDPLISKLRKEIDGLFLKNKKKCEKGKMCDILNFIIQVGKLKRLGRTGWILAGVKNPETVAQHTFQMAFLAWFLGGIKGLDTDRIVKIALVHDLCEVYAGDQTPYDPVLATGIKDVKKLVSKPPRVPYAQRLEWLMEKLNTEWKALSKLTSDLPKELREEMVNLWIDFEEGLTKEGRFVYQVDQVVNLVQAIEYWKKDKSFPITPWWITIKEKIDDPVLLKFIATIDREFSFINNKNKKAQEKKRTTKAKAKK
ncbi:HD domain-containing protein [Patescibacteria group bacterium]|nr:HD domain-containing protein [Patescibacteria group bacterium]